MFFDFPLDQLEVYRPSRTEPPDFDSFWAETLDEAGWHPLSPRFEAADTGLQLVETYDVAFAGYGGQSVKGWLLLPRQRSGPLPCVVEYIGYGGGRGLQPLRRAEGDTGVALQPTRGRGDGSVAGEDEAVAGDLVDAGTQRHQGRKGAG